MSTNDVPGANAKNADELHAGCWAEHADGSLIFVKGTEAGQVVYEIYDLAVTPAQSYTDAMLDVAFKSTFSHPPVGKSKDTWTWHDKSPFPWNRVMRLGGRPKPGYASADDQLSAAARVAESLKLRGHNLDVESVKHRSPEAAARGRAVLERFLTAVGELFE